MDKELKELLTEILTTEKAILTELETMSSAAKAHADRVAATSIDPQAIVGQLMENFHRMNNGIG